MSGSSGSRITRSMSDNLDLMLSNFWCLPDRRQQPSAQEVIHDASLLPHGWNHYVYVANEWVGIKVPVF